MDFSNFDEPILSNLIIIYIREMKNLLTNLLIDSKSESKVVPFDFRVPKKTHHFTYFPIGDLPIGIFFMKKKFSVPEKKRVKG